MNINRLIKEVTVISPNSLYLGEPANTDKQPNHQKKKVISMQKNVYFNCVLFVAYVSVAPTSQTPRSHLLPIWGWNSRRKKQESLAVKN